MARWLTVAGDEAVRYRSERDPVPKGTGHIAPGGDAAMSISGYVATAIAITDQYAEKAMGDRCFFCGEPRVLTTGKPTKVDS
jgi:hypothetical protein